ncbi:LLM class flavin-dependent oxidoreductase [Nocardiopsis ansamitocini]|uniref:Monooxygenase n=1 Tax=Nocardiopsis ansamitocini TaxID=1670832 RepID=A0A9W6P211_9ACTN|nr:LLM class flavin-dependent oxidoreductase [Nocardiopsis ansamitocini]GLU45686.1 monooxygenase [Nocardiopsis ansamitocini]
MSDAPQPLRIGAAIDGAGAHPAAWRVARAEPAELFTAGHYAELAREAERGALDFVTLDDSLALQDDTGQTVRGRLDALLTLTRIAPETTTVGLVPTVTTTHTEPFHVSKAVATLDHVSLGRAGWRVQVSTTEAESRHFGRRPVAERPRLWTEAAAVADVVGRLWDSWEDDAEIRDTATGRFVDTDRLHYVDFSGPGWSVRGPSITPRPPQGHPLVVVRADSEEAESAAAAVADVVLVAPTEHGAATALRARIRAAAERAGRDPAHVSVLADLRVLLAEDTATAFNRRDRLDSLAAPPVREAGLRFTGTPHDLAARILDWTGAVDGFTLYPAVLPDDLSAFVDGVVPLLRQAGALRPGSPTATLRGRFGLPRAGNRYARA